MSFPTVKGILSDTVEETSKRPMAVRSGRRSGRASATILRKDVGVEVVPPALDKREAGRMRESMERCVGAGGGRGAGVRGVKLAAKRRFCAEVNVGHGGCPRLDEGCAKVRRTDRACRRLAPEEHADAATTPRRRKQNIKSSGGQAPSEGEGEARAN